MVNSQDLFQGWAELRRRSTREERKGVERWEEAREAREMGQGRMQGVTEGEGKGRRWGGVERQG